MMGRQVEQAALFYEFRLDERVPADHLLRRVDAVLDLSWVRERMAGHYSATGRPSVCPELMVRMLLVGYLYGIRSERRLCEEVDLNLAYRWFCRLGLDGRVPDHSTFTKNRHGRFHDSGLMREVFEHVVERCLQAGLASAAHVAVDGSFVRADASHARCVASVEELPREDASRAVREYLADLEAAAPDPEGVTRSPPKAVSLTDPAAALSSKHGPSAFAYGLNAMADTGSGIVLEVQAAPERFADEPIAARRMVERLHERHGAAPAVLTADKAYGTGPFLAWLEEEQGIEAHVPLIDRRHQTGGMLTQDAFTYDEASDTYTCPQGAVLKRYSSEEDVQRYRASQRDCGACPIKASCTTSKMRALCRSPHEAVRERVRARQGTPAVRRSMRLRKAVEHLFAHVKHHDGLRRLRLRGLRGADEQFVLAATARNLRRMARWAALPPRWAAMPA
jgi:transposase